MELGVNNKSWVLRCGVLLNGCSVAIGTCKGFAGVLFTIVGWMGLHNTTMQIPFRV